MVYGKYHAIFVWHADEPAEKIPWIAGWKSVYYTENPRVCNCSLFCLLGSDLTGNESCKESSQTLLYVVAILVAVIAVLLVVVIYLCLRRPKFRNSTKHKVVEEFQNKSSSGDVYDEVQLSPSSSGNNRGNENGNSDTYEQLHHLGKEEDEQAYQSLTKLESDTF